MKNQEFFIKFHKFAILLYYYITILPYLYIFILFILFIYYIYIPPLWIPLVKKKKKKKKNIYIPGTLPTARWIIYPYIERTPEDGIIK